ncbi:MAG: hypothetical protein R6V46_14190 [Desulfatiglandaceae bacterium]|jgi:hypothetical protein
MPRCNGCEKCGAWEQEIKEADTKDQAEAIIDDNLTLWNGHWYCERCLPEVTAQEEDQEEG